MIDLAAPGESTFRYIKNFEYKYGKELLHLACHAALPVVINADLVNLLRINFFLDPPKLLPFTSEADLLLSSFCHDIGDGLYEMAPNIRNALLQQLVKEYSHERVRDVAMLLWRYNERYAPWGDRPELERAQQLTALNFLDPLKAKQWLEEAEKSLGPAPSVEREWFVAMWKEIERIPQISATTSPFNSLASDMSELKVPKLGEAMHEAKVIKWFVKEGDIVNRDQTVAELETEKVNLEIPSLITGRVSKIRVKSGQTAKVGDVLVIFDAFDIAEEFKFGELLKKFRLRANMTQQALANKLGIHRRTISSWECSNSLPKNRSMVVELAKFLYLNQDDTVVLLSTSLFPTEALSSSPQLALEQQKPLFHLTVVERKELTDVLSAAFSQATLEQIVSVKFNKKLIDITGDNFVDKIYGLIRTAEAEEWIEQLVVVALENNLNNQLLRNFYQKHFPVQNTEPHMQYKVTTVDEAHKNLQQSNISTENRNIRETLSSDESGKQQQEVFERKWPGPDEILVIFDMLNNPNSLHWRNCRTYVAESVRKQAVNIPASMYEDITQYSMLSIMRSLPNFRHEARLTTWINVIVRNNINDTYRKLRRDLRFAPNPYIPPYEIESEHESVEHEIMMSASSEESAITREVLQEITSALEEYLQKHAKKERNKAILRLIIFEGQSIQLVAKQLSVSVSVVRHVVREAQKFIREKLGGDIAIN